MNIDEYWWILITRANCWPAPDECSTVSLAPCSLRIPPDKSSLPPPPSSRRKGSGKPSSMSWFLILLLQGEHRVILWVENWSPLWSVRKDSPPLDQERPRQKRFFRCVINNYVFAEEREQHELPPAKTRTDWAAAASTPCLGKDSRHSWSLNEYKQPRTKLMLGAFFGSNIRLDFKSFKST